MREVDNFGVRQDVTELTRLECSIRWTGYDPVGAFATSAFDGRNVVCGVLTEQRA
ncbi:hypothetical protein QA640_36275 [Bradyrhizobium sp. CB82]|uniref:hypothetical protein n=1 Tax=Bradyrhizobium sp. CB82 TaxID=3039159 RepID=UPI0024B04DE9|nr:hypothetical protein [Bradyrhizobium sp. CB82]WFU39751.1 hypothetical protein QA640_36275 [Bradyrhizobium sp. CB82]